MDKRDAAERWTCAVALGLILDDGWLAWGGAGALMVRLIDGLILTGDVRRRSQTDIRHDP